MQVQRVSIVLNVCKGFQVIAVDHKPSRSTPQSPAVEAMRALLLHVENDNPCCFLRGYQNAAGNAFTVSSLASSERYFLS